MYPKTFVHDKYQKDFEQNGYVVLPLLSTETINRLRGIYDQYIDSNNITSFTSTNLLNNKPIRLEIANEITKEIKHALEQYFNNITFWHPAFLIKPFGENTEFKLHQDWTFVDEEKYISGHIWIPLNNTDFNNGTICVIPCTHYANVKTLRAHTIHELFRGREDVLKDLCIPVPLKIGEAIIFQHSLVHYSPNNISNEHRVAVSCGFNTAGANIITHYRNRENIEVYSMPQNFVFEYDDFNQLNKIPHNGTLLKVIADQKHNALSNEELRALFSRI